LEQAKLATQALLSSDITGALGRRWLSFNAAAKPISKAFPIHFANALAGHFHGPRYLGNVLPGVVAPQDSCPLHLSPWCRLRVAPLPDLLLLLRGRDQPGTLGLYSHANMYRKTFSTVYVLAKRYTS
jgi:hypothetical protein